MDDIFDSLIYIIIAIVGFVISTLGKKKKKPVKRAVPTQQPGQSQPKTKERPLLSNLEKLLNEELGITNNSYEETYEEEIKEDQEPVLDNPVSQLDTPENKLDTVPEEMLDDKEDMPFSIEYDENSEIFNHSIKDQLQEEDEEEMGEVLVDFDLKDAIIYSEIINRKEY